MTVEWILDRQFLLQSSEIGEPDFTPLHFAQRFTGTFAPDNDMITARWETSDEGGHWHKDLDLTYVRISAQ